METDMTQTKLAEAGSMTVGTLKRETSVLTPRKEPLASEKVTVVASTEQETIQRGRMYTHEPSVYLMNLVLQPTGYSTGQIPFDPRAPNAFHSGMPVKWRPYVWHEQPRMYQGHNVSHSTMPNTVQGVHNRNHEGPAPSTFAQRSDGLNPGAPPFQSPFNVPQQWMSNLSVGQQTGASAYDRLERSLWIRLSVVAGGQM
ncbi:hypothetical protein PR048_004866 [Dryococelus australis]|uniref:Uncharacterized protein n=1 Tax=Dryococelus australis TaxID=614101 RepID=A0ABQ9I6M9_9NEOP|nr:hypothetical protein PR048_004866 [Dryococelus australis]